MRRGGRGLACLAIAGILLLGGCSGRKHTEWEVPLDADPVPAGTGGMLDPSGKDAETGKPDQGEALGGRQQTASGTLTDGTRFVLYGDGTLELSAGGEAGPDGHAVSAQIINEPILSAYQDKIRGISFG